VQSWPIALDAARVEAQGVRIQINQSDLGLRAWKTAAIDKEAAADARVQVQIRAVFLIERMQSFGRAVPREGIREAVHETIVAAQHPQLIHGRARRRLPRAAIERSRRSTQ